MEDEGILDPLNQIHLAGLHYIYLKLINKRLNVWRKAWSKDRMRTTRTSPLRLWYSGQLQNPIGFDIYPESLELYGVEGNVEDDYIEDERPTFVPPADGILGEEILECLHAQIPLNDFSANYGIDDYMQLITLSRDTIQPLCKVSLYQAIIKKFLGTFLHKYLFNDLNGFICKFTQIKL